MTFREHPRLGIAYLMTEYIRERRVVLLPYDRMHYVEDKETIDLIFSRCASSSTLPFPSSLLCAILSKDPHLLYASFPDAWRGAALKPKQVMDAIPLVSHHGFCIV